MAPEAAEAAQPGACFDVLIIGSGPAGIAAAGMFQRAGLRCAMVEKGALAQAVLRWPLYMRFFSTAANVELPGFPLITTGEKPTREEYLHYLRRYVHDLRLQALLGHEVHALERLEVGAADGEDDARFVVRGQQTGSGEGFALRARAVVIATGAYDIPKMLGCPGEDLPKVSHYFTEVHPYAMRDVAVVGGRNSAAEVALLLYRAGARVTLIHRGAAMDPLKYWLQPDLDNRIERGEIEAHFHAQIERIEPHQIIVRHANGRRTEHRNDFVLAMTGYRPDRRLLEGVGVPIDERTNIPEHDPETLETRVPGLFVAGVVAGGDISGAIFIENSRNHGEVILRALRREVGPAGAQPAA